MKNYIENYKNFSYFNRILLKLLSFNNSDVYFIIIKLCLLSYEIV